MTAFLVLIVTIITSMACALIGNFLVLRKLSLLGDAISHAVLPGIVVAFLLAGTLDSPLFYFMAVFFAVFMAITIQWVVERISVSRESIIGVIFTFLFAVGVIMLVRYGGNVHLDQDALLYGSVEFSAFDRLIVGGVDVGPRALWTMGTVFLINLLVILLFWKELKITTFDPKLAASLGISVKKMQYLVMILTSITVVAAFEAVGAILVVALLVVPPATAYILSSRLHIMIVLSLFFAVLASWMGNQLAFAVNGSIAGAVATACGFILFAVVLGKRVRGRF